MQKRESIKILLIIIIIASGGGLNELAQLSMYPLYKFLSADINITAIAFQHIIGVFFVAAFLGSLAVAFCVKFGSFSQKLLVGLLICSVGAVLSIFANTQIVFIGGRFCLGFGSGIIYVMCTAGVMELFVDKIQVKLFGLMTIVFDTTLLLSVASVIFFSSGILTTTGSAIIAKHTDWRSVFLVLAVIYGIYFVLTLIANKDICDRTKKLKQISFVKSIRSVFSNKHVCVYVIAIGCYIFGNIIFMVSSPILFIDKFHLSALFFSSMFVITILMSIAGAMTITLIKKPKNPFLFCNVALFVVILNVFILFVLSVLGLETWVGLLISYSITNYFFSLSLPLINQLLLLSGGDEFSLTASINQAFAYLVCWIGAMVAAWIPEETLVPASALIFASYIVGYVLLLFAFKKSASNL